MGHKSGITGRGYDPRIFRMQTVLDMRVKLNEERERMENNSTFSKNYWMQRSNIAAHILFDADPANGEAWFDDERNVPAQATCREVYYLCYAQIVKLTDSFPSLKSIIHRGILVWSCQTTVSVFDKPTGENILHLNEFGTVEEAKAWIDGLEWKHMGYGVVLDIVPTVESE